MVDSFGKLPDETVGKLSLSKSSRTRGDSARKSATKAGKSDKTRPVRRKLVNRVRAEIEAGTFETPDRIEATIDCILDEILEK
jgi:hypothetical protein